MSDQMSAPAGNQAIGPNDKPGNFSHHRSNSGRFRGRGGTRGGGGGHAGNGVDDEGLKRKKPELEHYKPGAFNSSRRGDSYESGNNYYHQQHNYHHDSGVESKHFPRGNGRGGSGRGRGQQYHQQHYQRATSEVEEKVEHLTIDNSTGSLKHPNKRRPRKQDQNFEKNNQEVEEKPKESTSKSNHRSSDDARSDGGSSNTSTFNRNKYKNKQRNSIEKNHPSAVKDETENLTSNTNRVEAPSEIASYPRSAEKSSSSNNTQSHFSKPQTARQPSSLLTHPLSEDACEMSEPPASSQRINGFVEKSEEDASASSPSEFAGRGRYMGGRGRGRRGGFSNSGQNEPQQSKPADQKDEELNQRPPSPDPNRSSSERNSQSFDERRSPSTGANSNQYSPPRRGGSGGRFHQRSGTSSQQGYHRNSESSDWRFHQREIPHDEYFSHQNSYERWGNEYKGGRGGKIQLQKPVIPPRFQRHHHQQDEEPTPQPTFRRRGSGRRSEDSDVDRSWRRDSQSNFDSGDSADPDPVSPAQASPIEPSAPIDWSAKSEDEEKSDKNVTLPCAPTTPIVQERGIIRLPQHHGPISSWRQNNDHDDNNSARRTSGNRDVSNRRNTNFYTHQVRPMKQPLDGEKFQPGMRLPSSGQRLSMDPRHSHPPPNMYRPPFPQVNQPQMANHRMPFPHQDEPLPREMEIINKHFLDIGEALHQSGFEWVIDNWDTRLLESRRHCLVNFRSLIQNNLIFVVKHDVEYIICRICFYNLVELLKTKIESDLGSGIHQKLIGLIDEGIAFYEDILIMLHQSYKINMDKYYDVLEPRADNKSERTVLASAQKCLLCLGDLARYKEMINNSRSFGTAKQYYQKACCIDTRNGKTFNQLAVLANLTKRKFEIVYYYMRSLMAQSPVPSSRQAMMLIFSECAKKWDIKEKEKTKEREEKQKLLKSNPHRVIRGTKYRKEIWIKPEGGRRLHRTTSAREGNSDSDDSYEALQNISTSDLNRCFNSTFLHLIGTLFNNLNVETFNYASDILLNEFRALVSRSPLPLDARRLVQIMSLNMFIIEDTKMKENCVNDYRKQTQSYALQLAFGMFGILLSRCNVILESYIPRSDCPASDRIFEDEDLPALLAAVKVWCDWIIGNNDMWIPVVSPEPFVHLAKLATHLEKLRPVIEPIFSTFVSESTVLHLPNPDDFEMVKLEEDAILSGFTPWFRGLNWAQYRTYKPKNVSSILAQDVRRLLAINYCVDFLEGHDPPILKWSSRDSAHISLVGNDEGPMSNDKNDASNFSDILNEAYSDEEVEPLPASRVAEPSNEQQSVTGKEEGDTVCQLWQRKEELERTARQKELSTKKFFDEQVSVVIEIRPKSVVPDTNCFVDFLPDIMKISSSGVYNLRVPLVVLNELDGLSKGAPKNVSSQKRNSNPDHTRLVMENARSALKWLKERPANTKCVTSKGTVLSSMANISEEDTKDVVHNDDLILHCCLALCTGDTANDRENLRVVRRDVVLLTEDRNLRVKAHTNDLPVTTVSDFMQWAFSNGKQ